MPSPYSEVSAFEPLLEACLKTALTTAGATPAYKRLDVTESLPDTRIVVEASSFSRASEQMAWSADVPPHPFSNHFSGQVTLIITTPRSGTGPATHATWLGLVRALMARPPQTLAGLPFEVLRVAESASTVTYINEGERDRSELTFDLEVAIPGAAVTFA